MSSPLLLVDGRVLDDHHPGVRRFWVPILCAWAARGGKAIVAHQRGFAPEPTLAGAGFSPIELRHSAYDPRGLRSTRAAVRQSAAAATLSPLYLTIDGAQRNVATVFDLIGRDHPRSLRSRLLWELMMRRTVHGATRVVCATAAVGSDLVERFPKLRDRVALVSSVAPSIDHPHVGGVGQPYALVVASHRPHKRLDALAAAWRAGGSAVPLVMLGRGTEQLHSPPLIQGLGFVSDDEVDARLTAAGCVVSSSLAEGFGLPVLTALAAGVPVAATRDAALEEVAGDAVRWVEPDDIAGLVGAAHAIIADSAGASIQVRRGLERARMFTANRAAQQLERALE